MTPTESTEELTAAVLRDIWHFLVHAERLQGFKELSRPEAENLFLGLSHRDQAELLLAMPPAERRSWMRLLPPDDAADLAQVAPAAEREGLLALLDEPTRCEVDALLAYAEDRAGGRMNPRYARVRPDMTVEAAIDYLGKQTRSQVETLHYVYVLDQEDRLVGVVSFRDLLTTPGHKKIQDIMGTQLVTVGEEQDQEEVARLFRKHSLRALPVVDQGGRLKGIVTIDDMLDVLQKEATEDIQRFGGVAAIDAPYLKIGLGSMLRKRGGWLSALFLGEMLTATAMAHFEDEIARAVVLALFVPLIISSGGNSGSQASTLVVRAMALGEVRLRDWWRVVRRELVTGFVLGTLLGTIGFLRIVLWQAVRPTYGEHYLLIALTVFSSLIGVVMFGCLAGSFLPFILRRFGLDPASASAPFVATLVDVTGLVIYFTVAAAILRGTLL